METQEEVINHKVKMPESIQQQSPIKNRMKIKKVPVEISKYNDQHLEEDFAGIPY